MVVSISFFDINNLIMLLIVIIYININVLIDFNLLSYHYLILIISLLLKYLYLLMLINLMRYYLYLMKYYIEIITLEFNCFRNVHKNFMVNYC